MKHFTSFDFQKLTDQEKELNKLLQPGRDKKPEKPTEQSLNNILAYSKSLSVRKSKYFGFLENVLN